MAQGKLKVKTKVPPSTKKQAHKKKKGSAATQRRGNAPIQPKKSKFQEANNIKKMITKNVNKSMEEELRKRALDGKMSLTKKGPSEPEKEKK